MEELKRNKLFFQLVSAVFKYLNINLYLLVFFQGNLHTNMFGLHCLWGEFQDLWGCHMISCLLFPAVNMVN